MSHSSSHRQRTWCRQLRAVAALCCCLPGVSGAQQATAERARIASDRAAAEAQFLARERECETRFVVTACLDEARQQRSSALSQLKRRQVALDDAERRQRAAQRKEQVQAKVEAQATRRSSRDGAPVMSTRAGAEARRGPAPAAPRAAEAVGPGKDEAAERAQRSQSHQRKIQAAQGHRESVQKRAVERAAKGKTQAALPVPDAASIPR